MNRYQAETGDKFSEGEVRRDRDEANNVRPGEEWWETHQLWHRAWLQESAGRYRRQAVAIRQSGENCRLDWWDDIYRELGRFRGTPTALPF